MKKFIYILIGLLCLLAALLLFTVWQVRSFHAGMDRITDTTGAFQFLLAYTEGTDEQPEQVRLEGEKEGLRQMHVLYSDNEVSGVECYADLHRSELYVNGLSAVPALKELLPPETGVYFTLDQIETIAGKPLIDAQIRYYYSEERIRTLLDQLFVLPCPRFLLPEDMNKEGGNGKAYRIPGAGVWLILEPEEGDGTLNASFYISEEGTEMSGSIRVTPDDTVQIEMPDPVSDTVVGWLKTGREFLS